MPGPYRPPRQSGFGQAIDSIFLLALVYVALLLPILLGLTGGETTTELPDEITWETLGQNAVMQAQWEKLGYDAESAAEIIATRFDYGIDPLALLVTIVAVVGYFVFLVTMSEKEYREVIAEKFGPQR